jgi:hypothetical protein
MNKTIYCRNGEEIVWEHAKRIAGLLHENISTVIIAGLRQYVKDNEQLAAQVEAVLKGKHDNTN